LTVITDEKLLPTLSVQLLTSNETKLVIAEHPEYIVRMKTELSEKMFVYKIQEEKGVVKLYANIGIKGGFSKRSDWRTKLGMIREFSNQPNLLEKRRSSVFYVQRI